MLCIRPSMSIWTPRACPGFGRNSLYGKLLPIISNVSQSIIRSQLGLVPSRPIEPVTSGNLLPGRKGEWWLAGPDGSIHVVSEDGQLHDSFNYGAALTGLAAVRLEEQPVLLLATDAGVTAWTVE